MTIKEIEERTGLTRANIRFYESEGLLHPNRTANGYRDYSQQDLNTLNKIKLLRTLQISLEDIKALHTGEQELQVALQKHMEELTVRQEDLDIAQNVCRTMYRDGVEYRNLNAEKYLNNMMRRATADLPREKFSWETYWELSEDTLPKVYCPWRRFFARTMDEVLYTTIWNCFLMVICNVNVVNMGNAGNLLDIIMTLLLTLLLEPLQLCLFGTTFGKWVLGIQIRDNEDRKLTYTGALARTKSVLWHGAGLYLPIYNLYRYWKSYKAYADDETLDWEYDTTLTLRDEHPWRIGAYIAVRVAFLGMLLLTNVLVQVPKHRGNVTIAQFCENYRQLEDYYDMGSELMRLTNNGEWVESNPNGSTVIIVDTIFSGFSEFQDFRFEVNDGGTVTEVGFTLEVNSDEDSDKYWMPDCQEQMQLAVLAFVGAQEEFPQLSGDRQEILEIITSHPFEDYSFTKAGVTVSCDVEYQGYSSNAIGHLLPAEEGACSFYLNFFMKKDSLQ